MDTLFSNVNIVTMNEKMEVLLGAYLGVTDGKISYISKTAPQDTPQRIVDGTGMVLLPGLINCHTHLVSSLLRGYCDDLSQHDALEQQLRLEDKLDPRCAKAAATVGIAQCLRFGITSVSDLYYFPDALAEVAAQAGIKANIALSCYRFEDENEDFDFETDPQCRELRRVKEKWHGYDDGRIRVDAGILSPYTSNFPLWEALGRYAKEENLGLQLHLAQTKAEQEDCQDRTGLEEAQLLACHDLFLNGGAAAGCNVLSDQERSVLAKYGVSAVVCPTADGKSGRLSADVLACVQKGMNVALGTGGSFESGSVDLFEAMGQVTNNARTLGGDSDKFPAQAALMMATVCGARAQGRTGQCGMLKVGMDADLCLVDFSAPHLMPCHNLLSGLVHSARGGDVAMTVVRGKVLYANGKFPTLDLEYAVKEMMEYAIPKVFAEERSQA